MRILRLPLLCTLIVSIFLTPVTAQQKRRPPEKTAAKPPAAPAPAPPTFENLIAADSFKVYIEGRGVGQLLKSSALSDVLEPILKIGGPPKDFVDVVEWLKSHGDELATSRMLVAISPNTKDAPEFVAAIEFSSAEEAAKFEKSLDHVLPTMFPPQLSTQPDADKKTAKPEQAPAADQKPTPEPKPPAPLPGYSLQRAGSLLIVTPAPVQLKKLRPAGSKPLSEDPNFRLAYNRFASDPLFLFVDFKAIEREDQEQQKQWEEERKKAAEAAKERAEQAKQKEDDSPETDTSNELPGEQKLVAVAGSTPDPQPQQTNEPSQAELATAALSNVSTALFSGARMPVLPDALGLGFSPENDSFDLRALMIDSANKTSDPIPLFPWLKFGTPIAPQSPTVIPADSELVLTMSLDFQQLYARLSAPSPAVQMRNSSGQYVSDEPTVATTALENLLKIKIKDDLLPLIGSEVAVSLPLAEYNPLAPTRVVNTAQPRDESKEDSKANSSGFLVVVSLRDKEGMRKLLPKLVEGFAGKAAASLAQTEKREDTELVSFGNMFAYAIVGDFLVLSNNAASTRHVVDSYLKGATLASDPQFRNYTRWQPHEVQGQVYVSAAFMEDYKSWANNPDARVSDEARAFFMRVTATGQPITYSFSNDGLGTVHELHIPKNVLLVAIGTIATSENPPPTLANERAAMSALWTISYGEEQHKQKNSTYASLEELIAAQMVAPNLLSNGTYKFEFAITGDGYSVSAVPTEYGKTGKLSFFLDQRGEIRGGDHGGAPASASDPVVRY